MKTRISTLVILMVMLFAMPALSQTDAEKEVMKPINNLFLGMKKGDSALVHSVFTKKAALVSIGKNKKGEPDLDHDKLQEFLVHIGTPHAEQWNELTWDYEIRIDNDFAQVWCKFAFHRGKKFSHCGVDAFHLFRDAKGTWRIFALSDTRQKEGCSVPASVTAKLNE